MSGETAAFGLMIIGVGIFFGTFMVWGVVTKEAKIAYIVGLVFCLPLVLRLWLFAFTG